MKKLINVLLSLLVVSVLSGCSGFVGKTIIHRPASLVLPVKPTDKELGCLSIDVFSRTIQRDSAREGRLETLEGQIDAHNK